VSEESGGSTDQTPCEECGDPIRFDTARAYYKTPDERFWHPECLPEDLRARGELHAAAREVRNDPEQSLQEADF